MQSFVVKSDEIEGRLDPYYVKSISNIRNINTNYKTVTLSSLLKEPPQYGANESATDGNPKTDVRYIRITDIDEFGNLKNNGWKTATSVDEKYLLNDKDILFARSGATAGKTFIYDKSVGKAIFAGYLIRFRIDKTKANPLFVFYYTQLKRYGYWLKLIQRPSGQPNINAEEFKSFELPLPSLPVQNQIVEIMQLAYSQKKQKETEAQRFLDSIDGYVLDELGINLPEVKDKMCFVIKSEEMQNNRGDAFYFKPKFLEIDKRLKEISWPVLNLGDLINDLTGGATPKIESDFYTDETGIPFLRVQNITENGIQLDDIRFIKEEVHEGMLKRSKLQQDNLVFTITGRIGSVAVVPNRFEGNINQHSVRIQLKKSINGIPINPYYIATFFNTGLGKKISFRNTTGGTRPALDYNALRNLPIPFPNLEIQNKIAEEVKRRISEAERLKAEANKIVEDAKKKVEKMILGDN